jgi:branched-chain amino acid transport system permease protein
MDMFVQLLVSGLSNGALYALVAVCITIVYKGADVVNFAAGEFAMVGAFLSYGLVKSLGINIFTAILLAGIVIPISLGLFLERSVFRPLIGSDHLMPVTATIALSFFLRGIVRLVWGSDILTFPALFSYEPIVLEIGSASVAISRESTAIFIICTVLMAAFFIISQYSKFGKIMRATSDNRTGALLVGIRVTRVVGLVWAVGFAVAAIAGILFAPLSLLYVEMGGKIVIKGFASCILGGFGHLPGAVIGGLLMGLAENMVGGYISTSILDVSSLILIFVVLIIRPNGLFGVPRTARIRLG